MNHHMRHIFISAALAAGLLGFTAPAQAGEGRQDNAWLLAVSANSGSWSASGLENKGSQTVEYLQLSRQDTWWGFAVTGKYVNTSYTNQTGGGKLDINSPTQTNIATYLYHEAGRATFKAGVDLDLPTGKNSYTDLEIEQLVTDALAEDLMLINSYGEGQNIIPHALAALAVSDSLSMGLGVKYEITGKYDITEDTQGDELDPGDRMFAMANAAFRLSEGNHLIFTVTYASATEDKQAGSPVYKQGALTAVEARWMGAASSGATIIVSAAMKQQGKNETLGEGNKLSPEVVNSNNNATQFFAAGAYPFSRALAVTAMAGYKSVSANGYEADNPMFDGGRTALFIEPGVRWSPKETMYITLKGRYASISDKRDSFSAKDTSYTATNIDLGLAWEF